MTARSARRFNQTLVVRAVALAAAVLALTSSAARAGQNQWTSHGPYGGAVTAVAIDPTRPGTLYASVPNDGAFDPTFPDAPLYETTGVYKTVDGGAHWTLVLPTSSPYVPGPLTIDPNDPETVYAQAGGMFRTTDGGLTWTPMVAGLGLGPIVVDPRNSDILYSGFLKSLDGGATWNSFTSGLPNVSLDSPRMDLAHPDVLYTLVYDPPPGSGSFLYRTQDGGSTWTLVATPVGNLLSVAVDPVTSRVFLVTSSGIFRSPDGGATWSKVQDGVYGTVASIRKNEVYVWGGSPLVVIQSKDGGDTWATLSPPAPSWGSVAGSPLEPSTVYLGLQTAGVGKSSDGGTTWSIVSQGISSLSPSLAMDPAHPSDVYTGTSVGLFHSGDGGGSWSLVDSDPSLTKVAIQPGTLALFSKLGRSGDGGVTWQPIPYPDDAGVPVIAAAAPQVLFVGRDFCRDGLSPYNGEVFRSDDAGQTWNLSFEPPLGGCTSIAVSPSGSEIFERVDVIQYGDGEVFASHNGGDSWAPLDVSGWAFVGGTSLYARILAVDPISPNVVYASNGDSGGPFRLWMSTVGGGQWRAISNGLPSGPPGGPLVSGLVPALVVDPVSPSTLYAATEEGVYRSVDGGASWTSFSAGLPAGPARNLAIDGTGRFLHVTAAGTVYDIEISGSCGASNDALCLLGGRFVVTAQAIDPRTGLLEVGTAVSQSDEWGYFSLPGFTGDPSFPEIVVKMVDATSIGDGFWFFHSGLTDLEYTLSVLDTVTGQQKSYQNDRSDPQALCGGADTGTFTGVASASGTRFAARAGAAPGSSLTLLGRFTATLAAVDPRTGNETSGVPVARDAKWGYFSLPAFTGDPSFPEVFVKMADGTALNGYFWVFHTGLTDLEYTLTVTDSVKGAQRVYHNERTDPSHLCGGADTVAFHD